VAAAAWRGGRSGGRKELADEKRPIGFGNGSAAGLALTEERASHFIS
jgi:hypothetical protein